MTPPLLFIHVPKTAGTSIRKTLREAGANLLPTRERFSKHVSAETCRRHYGAQYDKAHTFAVVRNPLEWLWSFYRFIKWTDVSPDTGKPWRHQIYRHVAPLDFPGFVKFACVDDGLSLLSDARKLRAVGMNRLTQSAFVTSPAGKQIVKSVFRFERIENDLAAWLSGLGVQIQRLESVNVSRRPNESVDDIYTEHMLALVKDRFAPDFDLWERLP